MLPRQSLTEWSGVLRRLSEPVLAGMDRGRWAGDELGHRREVDWPLLRWLKGRGRAVPSGAREGPPLGAGPDVGLWEALTDPGIDVDRLLRDAGAGAAGPSRSHGEWSFPGLLPQRGVGLEVWTERDLCAIHALHRLGVERGRGDWMALSERAAGLHVSHVQPDNATAHPWAIHVFVGLGLEQPGGGATLFAQTLLHNCQVALGRPDALSALILLDAADALEGAAEGAGAD